MLTPAQKAALNYHLRETNLLSNEELILELADHYTTALGERMTEGMTFETALTATKKAFGGRKGLQRMERQYNRVTFRHYDERWRQALISQFQKPLLWRQTVPAYAVMLLLSFIILIPDPIAGPKWANFADGALQGLILGSLIPFLGQLWPYLKTTIQHGFHNVPAEILYLMKRQGLCALVLYSVGISSYFGLLPFLLAPIQAILISTYLGCLSLFILTSQYMRELLYEYEPSR